MVSGVFFYLLMSYNYSCFCSVASVKRVRKSLGLLSTRQQKHNLNSIHRQIEEIRARFPTRGIENIRKSLHTDYGMFVPRCYAMSVRS